MRTAIVLALCLFLSACKDDGMRCVKTELQSYTYFTYAYVGNNAFIPIPQVGWHQVCVKSQYYPELDERKK